MKGIDLRKSFLSEDKTKLYLDLKASTEKKGFMNKSLFATKKVRIYNLSNTLMLINCSCFSADKLIKKVGAGVSATGVSGNVELDNSNNQTKEIMKMDPGTVKVIKFVDYVIFRIMNDSDPKKVIRPARIVHHGEEYLIVTKECFVNV